MSNVVKGTAIDFEKINSLDGTFLINRYNGFTPKSIVEAAKDHHYDRDAQVDLRQTSQSIPMTTIQEDTRTYITHNKGGTWELVQAP